MRVAIDGCADARTPSSPQACANYWCARKGTTCDRIASSTRAAASASKPKRSCRDLPTDFGSGSSSRFVVDLLLVRSTYSRPNLPKLVLQIHGVPPLRRIWLSRGSRRNPRRARHMGTRRLTRGGWQPRQRLDTAALWSHPAEPG